MLLEALWAERTLCLERGKSCVATSNLIQLEVQGSRGYSELRASRAQDESGHVMIPARFTMESKIDI